MGPLQYRRGPVVRGDVAHPDDGRPEPGGSRRVLDDHESCSAVLDDLARALLGVARVHRQIGRAALERGQCCDHRIDPARKMERHDGLG